MSTHPHACQTDGILSRPSCINRSAVHQHLHRLLVIFPPSSQEIHLDTLDTSWPGRISTLHILLWAFHWSRWQILNSDHRFVILILAPLRRALKWWAYDLGLSSGRKGTQNPQTLSLNINVASSSWIFCMIHTSRCADTHICQFQSEFRVKQVQKHFYWWQHDSLMLSFTCVWGEGGQPSAIMRSPHLLTHFPSFKDPQDTGFLPHVAALAKLSFFFFFLLKKKLNNA